MQQDTPIERHPELRGPALQAVQRAMAHRPPPCGDPVRAAAIADRLVDEPGALDALVDELPAGRREVWRPALVAVHAYHAPARPGGAA